MLRPRRNTRIPLRYRESSPPHLCQSNFRQKRSQIDVAGVERNNVDQALAPIAAAPECSDEPPIPILTQLPHFNANYVLNRAGASRHTSLSEIELFSLFFDYIAIKILVKETNLYHTCWQLLPISVPSILAPFDRRTPNFCISSI
jgi:hypothetical protein